MTTPDDVIEPATPARVCSHCGRAVASENQRFCHNCRLLLSPEGTSDRDLADGPAATVRVYRGRQQADAVAAFRSDVDVLAPLGYVPTSQSWAAGQWGRGTFLVALVLTVVVVGILILIYLLVVKPEGTLTVTYQRITTPADAWDPPATVAPIVPAAASAPATLVERLAQLQAAREAGLVSEDEYRTKRSEVMGSI